MSETCKLCTEPLPFKALHFPNELAIEHGYCSWLCLSMDLGQKKALALMQEETRTPGRADNDPERA